MVNIEKIKVIIIGSENEKILFCDNNLITNNYIDFTLLIPEIITGMFYDLCIVLNPWNECLQLSLINYGYDISKIVFIYSDVTFLNLSNESLIKMLYILKEESDFTPLLKFIIENKDKDSCLVQIDGMRFIGRFDYIPLNMIRNNEVYQQKIMDSTIILLTQLYPKKQGKYFVDAGCNILSSTIYFIKKLNLCSIAFEPVAESFMYSKINAILNNVENQVLINNMILGNDQSSKYIYIEEDLGSSFVQNEILDENALRFEYVKSCRLDYWLEDNNIKYTDIMFIWLDAEGYEGFIVSGCDRILCNEHIPIAMEFSPFMLNKQGCYELLINELSLFYSCFFIIYDSGEISDKKDISFLGFLREDDCVNIFVCDL